MADKISHLTVLNEKKGEASTREFSQGAVSVLLGTLSHSIHCTHALLLFVLYMRLLELDWAATARSFCECIKIVGVASKPQQFKIAE